MQLRQKQSYDCAVTIADGTCLSPPHGQTTRTPAFRAARSVTSTERRRRAPYPIVLAQRSSTLFNLISHRECPQARKTPNVIDEPRAARHKPSSWDEKAGWGELAPCEIAGQPRSLALAPC